MSSFMNPSKRLTDLLSTYLEFDPQQLQLGIWSGDLSMKDVSLKRESINPILHDLTSTPIKVDERPPLLITLLKSEIGHFRFQIPWKRLVWGEGDVRLTLSDVVLVVGFESQTNCDDIIHTPPNAQQEQSNVEESEEERREVKQQQLREAERLMLQGLPISPAMTKKSRDATTEDVDTESAIDKKESGRLENLLKSITSSFLWRFFAGLQASIRNVRIVLIQDGVEIGVICHTMDAGAHIDEELEKKVRSLGGGSTASALSDAEEEMLENGPVLDAGDRQVDKQLKISGLGLFVRKETTNLHRVPRELQFSTSVTADDYVLRPSEVDAFFSIYYPSLNAKPLRKRPLKVEDSPTVETGETTTSSKARRGKRDRSVASVASDEDGRRGKDSGDSAGKVDAFMPKKKRGSKALRRATLLSTTSDRSFGAKPNMWSDASTHAGTRSSAHRSSYVSMPNEDPFVIATPHFDVHLFFGDIRTLCSKRHHHLVNVFCAAQAKMRNGRPDRTIVSEIGPDTAPVTRSVMVATPMTLPPPAALTGSDDYHVHREIDEQNIPPSPSGSISPPLPMPPLQRFKTDSETLNTPTSNKVVKLQLLQPVIHSERAKVVSAWWKYAFSNIIWQFRRRRHLRSLFKPSLAPFDWKKQRYLRKEYVDLYILIRLERRGFHARLAHLSEIQSGEEELLEMEDELLVEQILLYRSIARALGVRGLDSMPDSILELHGGGKLSLSVPEFASDPSSEEGGRMRSQNASMTDSNYVSRHEDDLQDGVFLSQIRLEAKNARNRRRLGEQTSIRSPEIAVTAESSGDKKKDEAAPITPKHRNEGFSTPATEGEGFPDMDSAPSLGTSQRNAAANALSPKAMDKPDPIAKKGMREVSFSKQNHDDRENKTVKTFKTARTTQSKRSQASAHDATIESKRVIRFAFSLNFQSIELMVCDDETDLRASLIPSETPNKYDPVGVLDEEAQSDDVSELSDVSSDFSNQDSANQADSEDLASDENIMSSTDFLLFGMPSSILHAVVLDVTFLLKGNSDGSRSASLAVCQFEITGSESCNLLRSETALTDDEDQNHSVDAVSGGQDASFENTTFVHDKALTAYYFDVDGDGKQMQCDLSKLTATLEIAAIMKVVAFFTSNVMYPGSVVPFSAYESVRTYLAERSATSFPHRITRDDRAIALRMHGFELILPLVRQQHEDDTKSLGSWNEDNTSKATVDKIGPEAKILLSIGLFEFYCGEFVVDSNTSHEDTSQAYFTAGGPDTFVTQVSDDDDSLRKLRMLDVGKILAKRHPFACQHSVITLSRIDCTVHSQPEAQMMLVGTTNLLEMPFDVEMLVSRPFNVELDDGCPGQQIVVQASPLLCLLSEGRLQVLSACILSLSRVGNSAPKKTTTPLPPRVAILSSHVLQSIDAVFGRIRLSVVSDRGDSGFFAVSLQMKEIIMEEAISDYLSLISCFDLEYPVEEPLTLAAQICMDRLSVLGLTAQETKLCAENARSNFLADVEIMKRSQTEVLMELSSGEGAWASSAMSSHVEDRSSVGNQQFESSEGAETSDEDTEETMEIIETTIGNAVEKTVRLFLPLVEQRHVGTQQHRETLVVDLEHGATISLANLFYDFNATFSASLLAVRNGAGIHVLKVGMQESLDRKKPDSDDENSNQADFARQSANLGRDSHSSDKIGVRFSRFKLDSGHEFGMGGMSLRALAQEENVDDSVRILERLDDVFIGRTAVFFSQAVSKEMLDAVLNLSRVSSSYDVEVSDEEVTCDSASDDGDLSSSVFCHSSSFSLFLASDELVPFAGFLLDEVCCRNNPHSLSGPNVSISADSFVWLNLTPEGQTYHEIVTPLVDEKVTENENVSLLVEITRSGNVWSESTRLDVSLYKSRIFVVRQHINDLIQYLASPQYGLGLLLNKLRTGKPLTDEEGNPPPPLLYQVVVQDSSLIIPRSSTSSELLAAQVDSLTISNSYHTDTWSLPTESASFYRGDHVWPADQSNMPASSSAPFTSEDTPEIVAGTLESTTDGTPRSDTEFQDCVDRLADSSVSKRTGSHSMPGERLLSSFDKAWISRIHVQCEGIRLFAALANRHAHAEKENLRFNRFYYVAGRAVSEELVYAERKEHGLERSDDRMDWKAFTEKLQRKWEAISNSFSIEVSADYAPHLRLLIADCISKESASLCLNLRMSQLYLLFSVWYSNMQELPVMFPYPEKRIKEDARSKTPPADFPEYGTDLYVKWLKDLSAVSFEFACSFREFSLSCSIDAPGYFSTMPSMKIDENTNQGSKPLRINTNDFVVHVAGDQNGILRLGCGASGFGITDQTKDGGFSEFLALPSSSMEEDARSWADLSWGLDCGMNTFHRGLGQPFQLSVFMTPNWCLINLGVDGANAVMFDLSPIWFLMNFFVSYFSDAAYGHPAFEAAERVEKLKRSIRKQSEINSNANGDERDPEGLHIDFRLWVMHPHLSVPSSQIEPKSPCVRIESKSGVWFRYKSLGSFTSQEIATTNLSLAVAEEFEAPSICRGLLGIDVSGPGAKTLVDGLSLALRYDVNSSSDHTNLVVKIPFLASQSPATSSLCGITSSEIDVKPLVLPPPTVCSPIIYPKRSIGSPLACEIMVIWELLPVASHLLRNLATGPSGGGEDGDKANGVSDSDDTRGQQETSFSVCAEIGSLRLFIVDPVLGMHLPVAVVSVASISCTASQLGSNEDISSCPTTEAPREDLQVAVDCHLWADYFKLGITRSWEPLLEPYTCLVLYEKSRSRGQGLSLNSDSSLHINVTGALLVTLDETINTLKRSISQTFGESLQPENSLTMSEPIVLDERSGSTVEDTHLFGGRRCDVVHEVPKHLKSGERVAFSFRNLTGQKIRIHQETGCETRSRTTLTYLDHLESTRLDFYATMSMFKNLEVSEVPFPGLPNSSGYTRSDANMLHQIDVQIPGFAWLQALSVDASGRRFGDLVPRSPSVLSKIRQDWRLENALKLLTEVGLENGGRLVTARSPFEIRNNTSHAIALTCHPDPRHRPIALSDTFDGISSQSEIEHQELHSSPKANPQMDSCERIQSGEAYHIPTLLLESALQIPGNGSHLGCLWIRPEGNKGLFETFVEDEAVPEVADYCSRPIQFAKVVHESSIIFASGNGEDLPSEKIGSGIQVSCPLSERQESVSFAPFCYVVETRRSPLVSRSRCSVMRGKEGSDDWKSPNREADSRNDFVHGPVSYSLVIHPPLVIVNLLPEGGRFELMHASRRTVLWFADLKPGERVPVHSVGLDAPLLLLINLGFCRTPVGEGALVHHGSATDRGFGIGSHQRVGLKTIGKAVTKGTKQVGKTLTDIIDSPDKRGQGKLFMIQNPQFQPKKNRSQIKLRKRMANSGTLGLDTGFSSGEVKRGKVHRVEGQYFSPEDVANETTVVDSIGQRLTLRIENVRGGGGQRRIALFCPFWIVNTTEHSLKYKQEKGASFTSGTVVSASQDGSKPVDGSNRNYISQHEMTASFRSLNPPSDMGPSINRGTIFAGTPGALASSLGSRRPSVLAKLLDKDLPLDRLASMAFMFNFHEDVITIGHQKLCVRLGGVDSRYTSSWSTGFSLDSVGVTQVIGMQCKEGRALELSVTISVAPAVLSGYTKIVRFSPRYVLLNQLEQPIRLWQDSSLLHTTNGVKDTKSRKWYIAKSNERVDRANHYELLFGRPVALSSSMNEGDSADLTVGTTADPSALYLGTAAPSDLVPFHLADTRSERHLRIDLGYPWNLTASFSSDITGEYTLKLSKAVDLRLLRHVSTRALPQYRVVLPPPLENQVGTDLWEGELGVWFETDWGGDKRIIVKGTKHGRYAFNHTDIHVGDELLLIDETPVSNMSFSDVMKLLKERIAYAAARQMSMRDSGDISRRMRRRSTRILRDISLSDAGDTSSFQRVVLTFRTVEERLRRLRVKASETNRWNTFDGKSLTKPDENALTTSELVDIESPPPNAVNNSPSEAEVSGELHVDLRSLHNSIFVFVRSQNFENPPFRIENRAINHVIHFRQRGCDWHPWSSLKPGESQSYTWEEPLRQKKLSVKVGRNDVALFGNGHNQDVTLSAATLSDGIENTATRVIRNRQPLSFPYVDSEEFGGFGATKTIKLEEIGFADFLPCPGDSDIPGHLVLSDDHLYCHVDTDGGTRVLVITDRSLSNETGAEEHTMVERHLATLGIKLFEEENKLEELKRLKLLLPRARRNSFDSDSLVDFDDNDKTDLNNGFIDPSSIELQAKDIAELSDSNAATKCHQVVVQVLEATGLNPSDFGGLCNPYCEVAFKGRMRKRRLISKGLRSHRTYYVSKTTSPKWIEQIFVFDVPTDAVNVTRGHSIRIRVRNFRSIGYHSDLGQTSVHLRSLRNQQELVGWYPLAGRSGRSELEDSGNLGRGSIKVRVQWIYTVSGLLDYFLLMSERRLFELHNSRDGMEKQLKKAIEADKRKKSLQDPFNIVRIPNMLGLSGSKQKSTGEEEDDLTRRAAWKKLRQSLKIKRVDGLVNEDEIAIGNAPNRPELQILKVTNANYLWWLHAQTEESKRHRKFGKEIGTRAAQGGHDEAYAHLEKVDEVPDLESSQQNFGSEASLDVAEIEAFSEPLSPRLLQRQNSSSSLDFEAAVSSVLSVPTNRVHAASLWDMDRSVEAAEMLSIDRARVRASSLSDLQFNHKNSVRPFVFRRHGSQSSSNSVPLQLPRDIILDPRSEDISDPTAREYEAQRMQNVNALFEQGILYHTGAATSHRRHLTYHFRESLLAPVNSSSEFRPKSNLRATLSVRDLKSWITAQAIVNDEDLSSLLSIDSCNESSEARDTSPSKLKVVIEHGVSGADRDLIEKFDIPIFAPASMASRALSRAENIIESRNLFEKACKRSLRSVLNPGGWLTIRPITALNLPDSYTGMSVKVRYGTEVLTSQTADAKVTPTWAFDDDVPLTPRPGTRMHRKLRRRLIPEEYDFGSSSVDEFKFDDNDLPIHIEPLQTSGTVRISVIGERINSKAEIGVLQIPLGAAISCCIESMYEYEEDKDKLPAPSSRFYVRWFPLMSPKDIAPVEGDLGLSSRPSESEKLSDSMFSHYFAPCIKLALIWQPDDGNPELGDPARPPLGALDDGGTTSVIAMAPSPLTHTYFNADIGRISTALVDSQRAIELLSVALSDIDIRYSITKAKTRTTLAVGWVQIDHQDDHAREPVVLAPTPVAHPQPTLQFITVKDNNRSKSNVDSYQYIGLAVQELDLTVEESWMFDLWEFFISVVRRREVTRKSTRRSDSIARKPFSPSSSQFHAGAFGNAVDGKSESNSLLDALSEHETEYMTEAHAARKVYVEQLLLGLVKVNLTYMKGGKKGAYEVTERGGWVMRDDVKDMFRGLPEYDIDFAIGGVSFGHASQGALSRSEIFALWCENTDDEELWTEREDVAAVSRNLPSTIASVFPSVSDARIRLQGKLIEHVFESPGEILASIQNYYVTETLRQIYKIIGSVDFVGNPSMLLSSLVTGVRDFVVAPSKELFRNPKKPSRVGIGCAKGTLSLFSHSASGFFGFVSKVSATAGQAAAVLSCDDAYRQWHNDMVVSQAKNLNRRWKKNKGPNNAKGMITKPLEDVVLGIISGTSGIFVSPYIGAKEGGAVGFAQGAAVGAIGVVVKPLVGVLDALAHFTGSVHDVAKSVNVLEKRYQPARKLRLPYVFGLKNVLMPFDFVTARSINLLKRYPIKGRKQKFTEREVHVASEVLQMEPGVVTYVIATTYRVILIRVKRDQQGNLVPSLRWQVHLHTGIVVSSSVQDAGHNGVALTITKRERNTASKGIHGDPPHNIASPVSTPLNRDQSNNSLLDGGDEDSHLGTQPSRVWESIHDNAYQRTGPEEPHLHGSAESKKGEILSWYRVLGEFNHRKQLTRMHNAICCICGDLGSVIWEKGLNRDGGKEGYTTFGQMVFEVGETTAQPKRNSRSDAEYYTTLETVPWMSSTLFKEEMNVPAADQVSSLEATRQSWLFSDELEVASQEGGPTWLVHARARATFVAPDPPPLPLHLSRRDEVVVDIFYQLKQGNISYAQACELLDEHAKSVDEEAVTPVVQESTEVDDLFRSAMMFDSTVGEHNASQISGSGNLDFVSARSSVPITLPTTAPEEGSDVFMSPLPMRQARPNLSLLDEEDERDEVAGVSKDDSASSGGSSPSPVSHSPLQRDEVHLDVEPEASISFPEPPSHQKEVSTKSSDSDDAFFISARSTPSETRAVIPVAVKRDDEASQESDLHSRLAHMETMMEQLVRLNMSSGGLARPGGTDDIAALRQELNDLQQQIVQQRSFYQEALATAALRQEVADLRREAAGHGRGLKDADMDVLRQEVSDIRTQFDDSQQEKDNDETSSKTSTDDAGTAAELQREVEMLKLQLANAQNARLDSTPSDSVKSSLKSSHEKKRKTNPPRKTPQKKVAFAAEPKLKKNMSKFFPGKR